MQTNFTATQLRDPRIAEADAILRTCVHYGFCTNTCPTYVLTRDENESPRGRIDLIRAMLEKGGPPDRDTVRHLDSCLSCLACMTTCAVNVDYMHLIDRARVHVEDHFRRPLGERVLRRGVSFALARPNVMAVLMKLRAIARVMVPALPLRLRNMIEMLPPRASPLAVLPRPGTLPSPGSRRVALLAGCVQQVLNENINAASIRLLQRHGCEVIISEGAGCCGSLALHMGYERQARSLASANIAAWHRDMTIQGVEAVVINASGCGTTVKDYGHLFADDPDRIKQAQSIARTACDISELVRTLTLRPSNQNFGYRVAYHDPCSIRHGQRIIGPPREILRGLGFEVMDVPEAHFCCGSAGTYNLLQPDMANRLGRRKARHIETTNPDIIATGNIGCMIQIARFTTLPVMHWVELADWATGGVMPPVLTTARLRAPAPKQASAASPAEASHDVGFW